MGLKTAVVQFPTLILFPETYLGGESSVLVTKQHASARFLAPQHKTPRGGFNSLEPSIPNGIGCSLAERYLPAATALTALTATPLCKYSTTCSTIRTPTISCASPVEPPMCGVASTVSRASSGSPAGGGSVSNTSIAAPATLPD